MPGHSRADLAAFLNGERRQVWAVHRETAESFYLPVGQAEALRLFTKTNLRCPYPGCTTPISTRGKSKRDHFVHLGMTPHETGRESEFHLAGKAMLVHWAASVAPEGAIVAEEQTVKDPATALLRRADVMVTGRTGRRVAYEVEYKAFATDDWRRKQDDYDAQKVACAWLIGHTRVHLDKNHSFFQPGPPGSHGNRPSAPVRVPDLAAAIAAAGYPVLVVNPVTRQVGTLAADLDFTEPYTGGPAWLAVEDLEGCRFDPKRGIVTRALARIDSFEAERAQLAAEEAERLRAQEERWERSSLRRTLIERLGEIPTDISRDSTYSHVIYAHPAHWHAVIYETLLHGRTRGETFKWRDVWAALDRHGIARSVASDHVYAALAAYFEDLEAHGFVKMHRMRRKDPLTFTCTGRTLELAREQRRQFREKSALAKQAEQVERAARAVQAHKREAHMRTRLVVDEDGTRRWVRKKPGLPEEDG